MAAIAMDMGDVTVNNTDTQSRFLREDDIDLSGRELIRFGYKNTEQPVDSWIIMMERVLKILHTIKIRRSCTIIIINTNYIIYLINSIFIHFRIKSIFISDILIILAFIFSIIKIIFSIHNTITTTFH